MSYTFATFSTLAISPAAYDEIRSALMAAGYDHVLAVARRKECLDMSGIALQRMAPEVVVDPADGHSDTR